MKESQQVEWKSTWRDDCLRWICGFANAEGGRLMLIIGRDDKGNAAGVENARKLLEDLPNKIRDVLGIMADVRLVKEAGKELIEIRVEPYPSPISYKGEYHYRSGSTKQELKGAALERFLLKKRGRHWDDAPEPSFTVRSCSASALRLFKQRATESGRMDRALARDSRESILGNLELIEKHGLKRAACLLFSDRPEKYVSGAWIKIGFFVTDDDLRYQDEVHGNLFEQVEKTIELLHTKYLKAYISYEVCCGGRPSSFRTRRSARPCSTPWFTRTTAAASPSRSACTTTGSSSGIPVTCRKTGRSRSSWASTRPAPSTRSSPTPSSAPATSNPGAVASRRSSATCREHGIEPPVYDFGMAGLLLTFRANPAQLEVTGVIGAETSEVTGEDTGEVTGVDAGTGVDTGEVTGEDSGATGVDTGQGTGVDAGGATQETQETTQETPGTTQETAQETSGTTQEAALTSSPGPTGEVPGKHRGSTWVDAGTGVDTRKITGVDTGVDAEGSGEDTAPVELLVLALEEPRSRSQVQQALGLRHEDHFRARYLIPALREGMVEMTLPDKPTSGRQQYRLTPKGEALRARLQKEKDA
jgi:ATP-dependent DNA helicase RecG